MTSKDIYTELNAFMGRMRDGESREMVENLQAAIEYQAEKIRIYEEKYKEATGGSQQRGFHQNHLLLFPGQVL